MLQVKAKKASWTHREMLPVHVDPVSELAMPVTDVGTSCGRHRKSITLFDAG